MAVLTQTEIGDLAQDRAQVNVTTDAPISSAELQRFVNDAYADVWEVSGGSIKVVTGATAWSVQPVVDTTGVLLGILTDIDAIEHLWATLTSGSTGGGSGDVDLDRVDFHEVQFWRAQGVSRYTKPVMYAVTRIATTTPADVNKFRVDVWPGVSGYYFPVWYVPQFTPLNGTTITTPDVNDIESRDIALLAAARIAPLVGNAELVPSILADVSQRTSSALARKLTAMASGKQDDAAQ